VAVASHSSGVGGLLSFSQCPYLLPGGLTTPAVPFRITSAADCNRKVTTPV
jgi:hypothetical protein